MAQARVDNRGQGRVLLLAALLLAGCKSREPAPGPAEKPKAEPATAAEPLPDPFGLGEVPTTAKAGEFVLCPPREWIDRAIAGRPEDQTFIYYGARMVTPGPAISKVRSLAGKEMEIPNSMIIPIRADETAVPGDILLTVWQSGSGMQRAIVVQGTPTEPKVRYLDTTLDNPTGAGGREDTCEPGTFHKLEKEWQVGTAVAVKSPFGHKHWKIVHRKGDRLLGLGFAGKMGVLDKKDCVPVPLRPDVKPGASAFVPYLGTFTRGTVKKVDAAIGRVVVEVDLADRKQEVAAAFGDVIDALPGS